MGWTRRLVFAMTGAVGLGVAGAQPLQPTPAPLPDVGRPDPEDAELVASPPGEFVDTLTPEAGEPPAAGPVEPGRFPLRPLREGGYVYEGRRFRAHVAPDGAVSFVDRRIRPRTGGVPRAARERQVRGEDTVVAPGAPAHDPSVNAHPLGGIPIGVPQPPLDRRVQPDMNVSRQPPVQPPLAAAGVSFDLNDEFLRMMGSRPYAREKAQFLAATSEFRMGLAHSYYRRANEVALLELPQRLARAWGDTRFSGPERRRLLYAMWAEAAETAEGRRARAVIEDFIRRELPPGSPAAFTPAELARVRATPEGAHFDPYGEGLPSGAGGP